MRYSVSIAFVTTLAALIIAGPAFPPIPSQDGQEQGSMDSSLDAPEAGKPETVQPFQAIVPAPSAIEKLLWKTELLAGANRAKLNPPATVELETPLQAMQISPQRPDVLVKVGDVKFVATLCMLATSALIPTESVHRCVAVKSVDLFGETWRKSNNKVDSDGRLAQFSVRPLISLASPPQHIEVDAQTGKKIFSYPDVTRWVWHPMVLDPISLSAAHETRSERNTCEINDTTMFYLADDAMTVDVTPASKMDTRGAGDLKMLYWWRIGEFFGVSRDFEHCQPLLLLPGTRFLARDCCYTVLESSAAGIRLSSKLALHSDSRWDAYKK